MRSSEITAELAVIRSHRTAIAEVGPIWDLAMHEGMPSMLTMNPRSDDLTAPSGVILSWLEQREDEIAALLADLVAIPTENPPGKHYRPCVDLLETHLREISLGCKRLESNVSRDGAERSPEILVATHGSGQRTLYFHGHYDVVPAQTSAQFQPLRKEHFLFGRGSADMKGG